MVPAGRLVVVSASFGAGHDGAAAELTRRMTAHGFTVHRHDFVDLLPRRAGQVLRELYRRQLTAAPQTWGWLLGLAGADRSVSAATRLTAMADRATLDAVGEGAAAVLSTYPLASQVLGRLRRQGRLAAPVVTYLTDLSVHPMWVADGVDVHLALHDEPARQAKEHGAADIRVVSPAVAPAFAAPLPEPAQALVRRRYGLPAAAPLALVVAGAWGVGPVEQAAADISATGLAVPVVVCGRNEALRRRVRHAGYGAALGWVDDMASLVRSCQVVVQNAGGLSSLEALTAGVPVVSYRCLPGHGRTNAEALDRAGWAPWIRDAAGLVAGLRLAMSAARPFTPAATRPETVLAEVAVVPGAMAA
jgi:UDP-N-acetylglucosamine:LPS N-acetylglucosamine transferase